MRKTGYNILLVIGLILTLAAVSQIAANDKKKDTKPPKNAGILSVKTSPGSYPVLVDGVVVGMSGVTDAAEFYLAPGTHRVEVQGPQGQNFSKEVEIRKGIRNCICLKIVETSTTRPCPYDVRVDVTDTIKEGDLVTFAAVNRVAGSTTPLNYRWRVFPESARITSGIGTPAITVDSTGLGGQTISAELDVTDDVYGATCFQKNAVKTTVEKIIIPPPTAYGFDEFITRTFDDDKARLDNFAIELQNKPDVQGYIIMYQGTDRASRRRGNVDTLSRRALDYLVKARGIDPRRIVITKGGTRTQTTYQLWIVPPGAQPPVPR